MKSDSNHPPRVFLKFFRWFCHPKLQKYIEGDLLEMYEETKQKSGKRKADIKFIINVILLCRPGIIRPAEGSQNLNTYGMYKSYLKTGARNLSRNRAYAVINVAGLALSMACAILIFSWVSYHTGFDTFHNNASRIYRIVTEQHRDNISYTGSVPSPLGWYLRNDHALTEKLARAFTAREILITLKRGEELQKFKEVEGLTFAEPEFFEIFNFPLAQGKNGGVLSAPNTAIITERMARKYFGDQNPMSEVFWLENRIPFTITGVLKDLPANTEIKSEIFVSYATLKAYDPWLAHDVQGWGGIQDGMHCYVLLKDGIAPGQVEEALQPYVKTFRSKSKNVHHYKLQPLADIHFDARFGGVVEKSKLWTLSVIGFFLIITACLNFINMATAQAASRSKEVGVRKVLGGFKRQLFWQFLTETLMVTIIGVVLALLLATVFAPYVRSLFGVEIPMNFFTDSTIALFSVVLCVVITFLAGYYPALVLSGFQPVTALKGKILQHSTGGLNARRSMIIAQFVISQILIVGMIVIMSQMRYITNTDLGFAHDAIVMIDMGIDSTQTKSRVVKNEMLRVPGVEKVSLCFSAPASSNTWGNSVRFDNATEDENFRTSIKLADADYLSAFDLHLAAGRNLTPSDTVREILVNEAMISRLSLKSPEEALGKMISSNGGELKAPIVGVVKDFHDQSFHEQISPILITTAGAYYDYYGVKLNLATVRTALPALEKVWLEQHPDQIFHYEFLDDHIALFYEAEEITMKAIQVFSFIAIFIGCLGLYGLVSFMVVQKTKEVGIRKVLGGEVSHILWIFGKEFIVLILIAALIASPVAGWLMNNWLTGFQFRVPLTAWTFVLAIGATLFIAACTVGYHVIRGATANPVQSLRSE